MTIPVIDLFAGPGGLGEGFSSLLSNDGERRFRIKLSIEKDEHAHRTLELRAFFRNFPHNHAPKEYYEYLQGKILREDLFKKYPNESAAATKEAWRATLGSSALPKKKIDERIAEALSGEKTWALIGGPPCQAYSLVGRSRVIGGEDGLAKYEADPKHRLYKHYLRVLAVHAPPVFIMENVKGLLSAKVKGKSVFDRILKDLAHPTVPAKVHSNHPGLEYRLVSLVQRTSEDKHEPEEFIVRCEEYGIPQARHRLIILGIRSDIATQHNLLERQTVVTLEQAIGDLPKLRSGVSKGGDGAEIWRDAIKEMLHTPWFKNGEIKPEIRELLTGASTRVGASLNRGAEFVQCNPEPGCHKEWYYDKNIGGITNHCTRGHIRSDLQRYFFAAVFAREHKKSPLLEDFPVSLLPAHKNVKKALKEVKFNDRFRVQLRDKPSTTVVSHIAKDGHYYIHYDPSQCRSLTVREAARLQTFPDNYHFEGPRTQQYQQVGNAVPPLLAKQIACIVADLLAPRDNV